MIQLVVIKLGNGAKDREKAKDNGDYLPANSSEKLRKSMTIAKFINSKNIQKTGEESGRRLGINLRTKDVNNAKVDTTLIMTANAVNCQQIACKLILMENV